MIELRTMNFIFYLVNGGSQVSSRNIWDYEQGVRFFVYHFIPRPSLAEIELKNQSESVRIKAAIYGHWKNSME